MIQQQQKMPTVTWSGEGRAQDATRKLVLSSALRDSKPGTIGVVSKDRVTEGVAPAMFKLGWLSRAWLVC